MATDKGQEGTCYVLILVNPPARVQIPALPLVSCVTLAKSLNLSVPQFLHLPSGVDEGVKGFCQDLTKLILVKH